MQDLFNLFYLYDYAVSVTKDEEKNMYIFLREYVKDLIRGMAD